MKYLILLLICTCFFSACTNSSPATPSEPVPTEDSTAPIPEPIIETIKLNGQPIMITVTTDLAVIRATPSLKADEIARKHKGDSIVFTNKITTTNIAMNIQGIDYNEPWLNVILEGNQRGWIYGGCINFNAAEHPELKQHVLQQRAKVLFGHSLAQQIGIYQQETQKVSTIPAFRTAYTRSQMLKDSLELYIANHIQTATSNTLPDFFWINELMDGLLVHYVEEKQQYYLFHDYKYWQTISQQSSSTQDDNFIEVCLATYPSDSIAYYFYGWQLPLDSTITCSLLGSNIHTNVLEKINIALDSNHYFAAEIQQLKQAIIDDISISDYYWLPLESIQKELKTIISKQYSFLVNSDWVEIKTRRQMLKNYTKNNIAVNLFEGQ